VRRERSHKQIALRARGCVCAVDVSTDAGTHGRPWGPVQMWYAHIGGVRAGKAGGVRAGKAGGECAGDAGGECAGEAGGECAGEAGGVRAGKAGGVCAGNVGGECAGDECGGNAARHRGPQGVREHSGCAQAQQLCIGVHRGTSRVGSTSTAGRKLLGMCASRQARALHAYAGALGERRHWTLGWSVG